VAGEDLPGGAATCAHYRVRMRWLAHRGGIAIAVVPAVLLLSACGLQEGLAQRPDSGQTTSQAPAINGTTLSGAHFAWHSTVGHPVVVDFWASWCGPCRAEQPELNTLAQRYSARGVTFIGVDMRDDDAQANAYRAGFHVAYDSVVDADEQISALYNVSAPPTTLVIDATGRVVDRLLGTLVGVRDDLDRLTAR